MAYKKAFLLAALFFAVLGITARPEAGFSNSEDPDFWRWHLEKLMKTKLRLKEFQFETRFEKTSKGCSIARSAYDKTIPKNLPNTLLFDNCYVASSFNYSELTPLLQIDSLGDLLSGKVLGQAYLQSGKFHFDESGKIVVDEIQKTWSFLLQCQPQAEEVWIAGIWKTYKYSVSCAVLDFLGTNVGTLLLTEKAI